MSALNWTREELQGAAKQLAESEQGRDTLNALLRWLNGSGLSLDSNNKSCVLHLINAAFDTCPGSARDAMRDALGEHFQP